MQVDAVIRVLVSYGDRIHDTIRPVREEPRKSRVAEVEYEAVAVPAHCEPLQARAGSGNAPQLPSTVTCRIRPGWQSGRAPGTSSCQSPVQSAA